MTPWSCLSREVNSKSKAWAVERANSAAFHSRGEWRDTVPWQSHSSKTTLWYMVWRCLDPCSERSGTVGKRSSSPESSWDGPWGTAKSRATAYPSWSHPAAVVVAWAGDSLPRKRWTLCQSLKCFFLKLSTQKVFHPWPVCLPSDLYQGIAGYKSQMGVPIRIGLRNWRFKTFQECLALSDLSTRWVQ